MASVLSPTAAASLRKNLSLPWLPSSKHSPLVFHFSPPLKSPITVRCNAMIADFLPQDLIENGLQLDASSPLFPLLKSGLEQLREFSAGLPEIERWEIVALVGFVWVYLTVRPGVLVGAIDAYALAPLQLAIDSLLGRRNLKMSDFVVGDKLGEGSFGIVYFGAIVPNNESVEDAVGKRRRRAQMDQKYKERVILKKVKDCIQLLAIWTV